MGSKLILLVDDDTQVLEACSRLLRKVGYRVNTSMNGEDALEYMRTDRPDLVITDNQMPLMDGQRMVVEMAGDVSLRSIPVVMHSSLYMGRPKGAEALVTYVNSPKSHRVEDRDLLNTVENVLLGV
jgi:CheY-like chemotaxis protein